LCACQRSSSCRVLFSGFIGTSWFGLIAVITPNQLRDSEVTERTRQLASWRRMGWNNWRLSSLLHVSDFLPGCFPPSRTGCSCRAWAELTRGVHKITRSSAWQSMFIFWCGCRGVRRAVFRPESARQVTKVASSAGRIGRHASPAFQSHLVNV